MSLCTSFHLRPLFSTQTVAAPIKIEKPVRNQRGARIIDGRRTIEDALEDRRNDTGDVQRDVARGRHGLTR